MAIAQPCITRRHWSGAARVEVETRVEAALPARSGIQRFATLLGMVMLGLLLIASLSLTNVPAVRD
ncbi:MAG: hypothetical protein EAZ24_02500 [Burkholderiales bacterium]|nr:MAG: hypothetical protein EAZ21_02850 [Betaproteobacteria bacterium]TAG83886.1 MAG: hypothetical protein EAZ24_02500 [Burkholderiales bacterium]